MDIIVTENTDVNAREHILELDRKLKGLRAEIDAKLQVTEEDHLIHLLQEIEQAINTLTPVVTLAEVGD